MVTVRPYEPADEVGWVRCRVLSFLGSAFWDAVEREKEQYERAAIELVADDGGAIVGLLDVECETPALADRPGAGGMIWHLAVHPDHQRGGIASATSMAAGKICLYVCIVAPFCPRWASVTIRATLRRVIVACRCCQFCRFFAN